MAILFEKSLNNSERIPKWLAQAKTVLLPKNAETQVAKNYRPIACLNIMYKLYTSCLNMFLCDHCEINNIITSEQAGGKKNVWGTTEQLLLNKTVLKEARSKRRNLYTVWLDYRKAFDSAPHEWLLYALKLAKTPEKLIVAIRELTKIWSTKLHLSGTKESITTKTIRFHKGIFQGDSLSVILFILSVNPLSQLLKQLKGYAADNKRTTNITHNFFIDDLKLFAGTLNNLKKLLDIVTTFSKDIDMQFGVDKCAYIQISGGKQVNNQAPLEMNDLVIQPVEEGDTYRYLGQDENIEYVGELNKERVKKELYTRCRKLWSSELSAYNKATAHNTFVTSVINPTFGIIDWNIEDLKEIDIRIRKIMSMNSSFHPNSDVDRLYIPRYQGGRGLKSVQTLYECRIASLYSHLEVHKDRNAVMNYIYQQEIDHSIRVGRELMSNNNITITPDEKPRVTGRKLLRQIQEKSSISYRQKVMHGYVQKMIERDEGIDKQTSQQWLQNKYLTSNFAAYACAIQEQEISTKYLINKRQRDSGVQPTVNNRCRLCKSNIEDITHVISSCPMMSSRYYLPMRHDPVAKAVFKSHLKKHVGEGVQFPNEYEFIEKHGDYEYWWNVPIRTSTKLAHNKPDILIWNKAEKTCAVVEISCPADMNITKKAKEKLDNYAALLRNLQMLYQGYKFEMVPIIVGALGYVPKELKTNLEKLNFNENEVKSITRKLQTISVSGTVKIMKTFMGFKM